MLCLGLLTVVGCSSGPTAPPSALTTGQLLQAVTGTWDAARPTQIEVTFSNESQASYGLNPCFRDLDRLELGLWRSVDESNRVCPQYLIMFKPGDVLAESTDLPSALRPGSYRFRFRLASPSGEAEAMVTSNSFQIPE
jgi:hypothetical protein